MTGLYSLFALAVPILSDAAGQTTRKIEIAPFGLVVLRCPHCNTVLDEIAPVCGAAARRKCHKCSHGPQAGRPGREVWVSLSIPTLSVLGPIVDAARAEIAEIMGAGTS